ncbi:katanin p60 ATPase-containing subunit A1 [Schistosoma bovis]|uniref:Katanin p60 ATPase-containing subunit A-like 2 n=1 Tax=Schistosoma bovis TaxID=6184 RepID=A0A430QR71_SCHBO|nr:katanin p60 ATPase-containing subunit A1 [Schistosoma bovis]
MKTKEEQRSTARKKNLLILVMHYLSEEGYVESAMSLSKETNLDFKKYEVCDNVDLETVLLEYESYYYIKFQKYPRITKKLSDKLFQCEKKRHGGSSIKTKRSTLPRLLNRGNSIHDFEQNHSSNILNSEENSSVTKNRACNGLAVQGRQDPLVQTSGRIIKSGISPNVPNGSSVTSLNHLDPTQNSFLSSSTRQNFPRQITDYRAIINQETRLPLEENQLSEDPQDIFLQNPNVRWDDIIGLSSAKRLVKEAVVYPIKYPQLFAGILSPWKGLLLYGPPGTGKTLLAKAVATECKTTFFNISASTIVSKWRGDSEKLVRVLFELARFHAPSTIFLDELDSLMSQRGSLSGYGSSGGGNSNISVGNEHEGSRRMKTELLMQMDGLAKSDDLVFLLAASNLPWELDHAMLRRLEKRILVDLPNKEARIHMFESFLPPVIGQGTSGGLQLKCYLDYDVAAELTEGYSGSDIRLVCKEAAMRVVRKIFDILENSSIENLPQTQIHFDPITTDDVKAAISSTMPSARQLAGKYLEWQQQFGSS